ncbi:MAG: ATP-dependent helicase C-terminal domain-containing protein [Planctomycetota bacterium]
MTPPGRGAIAILHVAGPGARALVESLFGRPVSSRPRYGRLVENGEVLDEVMVRAVEGFTGEETIEISCHGGRATVERIFRALGAAGARRAAPEELLERGVHMKALDRIRAEAWRLLPRAGTELAARVLLDQAQGALSRAVKEARGTAEEAARLLAAEVRAGRLEAPGWNDEVERWIRRVNFLARTCPELGIPPIDEAARDFLIQKLCAGAVSYKDLKERPALPVVREWLSPKQQDLVEKHAPERLELSNGRRPRVEYGTGEPPTVALTIQELYGVARLPAVALGRVAPRVEILAPNRRPVQVTADLAAFWAEHYPKVKKELQRRYPKHEWR